jgi:hypothetical protein
MKTIFEKWRAISKASPFSAEAFIARAVLIVVLYLISCLAGLKEYTTFLSGTAASLNLSWHTASTLGLVHLVLYFCFILLAPIFLITAGLLMLWRRKQTERK